MKSGNRGRGLQGAAVAGLALAIALASPLSSCGGQEQDDPTDRANPKLRTVELAVRSVRITAEVAATKDERARGLMYRKTLDDGKGMLFVLESDEMLSFWMKNTTIPLSLAYITWDGTIIQIEDLEPLSIATKDSERSIRYALEVPRGYFKRAGIAVGDKIEIPPLR